MRRLLPVLLLAVGLSACGGSTTTSPAGVTLQTGKPKHVAKADRCPPHKSFMGCAVGASPLSFANAPSGASPPKASGSVFPDVSSYQGCSINWSQIPVRGAIVKAWEFSQDPCLRHNAQSLKAAHKVWGIYQFVRYCNANPIISLYRYYRPTLPPVLDEEVSAAANCTAPMALQVHRALGIWPIEYTSPGTEQAGASAYHLVLWEADYGSHYPCLWTCPKAWQFGSPPFVYYRIPGLGYGDVNRDLGLLELGNKPPPPPPKCLRKPYPKTRFCGKIRYGYDRTVRDLAHVRTQIRAHHCLAKRRPAYCNGWRHVRNVDLRKLAAFRKKYA